MPHYISSHQPCSLLSGTTPVIELLVYHSCYRTTGTTKYRRRELELYLKNKNFLSTIMQIENQKLVWNKPICGINLKGSEQTLRIHTHTHKMTAVITPCVHALIVNNGPASRRCNTGYSIRGVGRILEKVGQRRAELRAENLSRKPCLLINVTFGLTTK